MKKVVSIVALSIVLIVTFAIGTVVIINSKNQLANKKEEKRIINSSAEITNKNEQIFDAEEVIIDDIARYSLNVETDIDGDNNIDTIEAVEDTVKINGTDFSHGMIYSGKELFIDSNGINNNHDISKLYVYTTENGDKLFQFESVFYSHSLLFKYDKENNELVVLTKEDVNQSDDYYFDGEADTYFYIKDEFTFKKQKGNEAEDVSLSNVELRINRICGDKWVELIAPDDTTVWIETERIFDDIGKYFIYDCSGMIA